MSKQHNRPTLPKNLKHSRKKFVVKARGFSLVLGNKTKIMAIANMTPDSFSQDGLLSKNPKNIQIQMRHILKIIAEGAHIIDIGGESTRPGAKAISIKKEIDRTVPLIKKLSKKINIPISIDTYKPEVAEKALDAGASIVNTIMGTRTTKTLLKVIKKYDAAIILMHIRGTPRTMQKQIQYKNLCQEIINELQKSIEKCLEIGIKSDRIIIDPGIGFGKTAGHNLAIIQQLAKFKSLKKPILVGTSRKSFIGKTLNKDVSERLMGTAASICASILNGAHIVRVHDIKAMADVTRMTDAIINTETKKL